MFHWKQSYISARPNLACSQDHNDLSDCQDQQKKDVVSNGLEND